MLLRRCLSLSVVALIGVLPAYAALPTLIPRQVLFGNPVKISPQLSPDGRQLAWIAPDAKGVKQVWVGPIGDEKGRRVTADPKRGIRGFLWSADSRNVLYLQDKDGDENFHLYSSAVATGKVRELTPFAGVRANLVGTDPDKPDELLIAMNRRQPELFDVYRLHLASGKLDLDTQNPGDVGGFIPDDDLQVRGAQVILPDGGTEIRWRPKAGGAWQTMIKAAPTDTVELVGFTDHGTKAILTSSLGTDTEQVVQRDLATGKETVIAGAKDVDAGEILTDPHTHKVQAVAFAPDRKRWQVIDPRLAADFTALAKTLKGDISITSRDDADRTWIVADSTDTGSTSYYRWQRPAHKATFLFAARPQLQAYALAPMQPIAIKARDGLTLHSYLTLPVGVPHEKLPMVLLVHGGPWGRDMWGFQPMVQMLANRGYAVLQVNFRASTGYGKAFLNAGNRQWGKAMHDDLLDAVDAMVKKGIADPKKVAIAGGSYGGYATLAGLAFTPDVFACGVDIVGPSNLFTLLKTIPSYWKAEIGQFNLRMGSIDDPKDEPLLRAASPLFSANRITKPLLILQGANDPRVKVAESEQIVDAIRRNGGSVVYVVYPDEGHGFARPENQMDSQARIEAFLSRYLGGRSEPLKGDRIPGATAKVEVIDK
jgi:dipeptidyl aminopeptidase/acylaminoacyl peptidase